jgi:para-aminobenzoate synthetase component 1
MFEVLNEKGARGIPTLFIFDFEMKRPIVVPLSEIDPDEILYDIRGIRNFIDDPAPATPFDFRKWPIPFPDYEKAFLEVRSHLLHGNSFLLNLSFPTPIETDLSLREIFFRSRAKYRLLYRDQFVVFSPETFVTIEAGRIVSHPMKGTIDASLPDAKRTILEDEKEIAEHYTIVDLIRNDIGMVAHDIRVDRFRYIEEIRTNQKRLYQVSSAISGLLPDGYQERIGDILRSMLPAGSVTGAPKRETTRIIHEVEGIPRGYYSGICGISSGQKLDSGVMIRFIERESTGLQYRSGGGITVYSNARSEYEEMIDKVYLPIDGAGR